MSKWWATEVFKLFWTNKYEHNQLHMNLTITMQELLLQKCASTNMDSTCRYKSMKLKNNNNILLYIIGYYQVFIVIIIVTILVSVSTHHLFHYQLHLQSNYTENLADSLQFAYPVLLHMTSLQVTHYTWFEKKNDNSWLRLRAIILHCLFCARF